MIVFPLRPLGPVEGGDGVVEGRDVADVRPQSSVTHPLDDLTQLGAIGHENKVDRQAVGGPRLGRPGDGHQRSSGPTQACRPLPDAVADNIENQIDPADVFQDVVLEVDELLRAEVERLLTVGRASGADDVGAELDVPVVTLTRLRRLRRARGRSAPPEDGHARTVPATQSGPASPRWRPP